MGQSMIKKSTGYVTDDGKMFASLNEAAEHSYGKRIKDILGQRGSGVFGVRTVIEHSREIAAILNEYNQHRDAIDREFEANSAEKAKRNEP